MSKQLNLNSKNFTFSLDFVGRIVNRDLSRKQKLKIFRLIKCY